MDKILQGKIIISTRPEGRSVELNQLLEKEGAVVLNLPILKVLPCKLNPSEIELLQELSEFNWVVFTSPNSVEYFVQNLNDNQLEILKGLNTAVVGNKTAAILRNSGIDPTLINAGNTAKDLAIELKKKLIENAAPKVLFPAGNLALNDLPNILQTIATVTRIHVYKSEIPPTVDQDILEKIVNNNYDLLIFASPSAINNLMVLNPGLKDQSLKIACMGGTTAKVVENTGNKPLIVPEDSSVKGLVNAIKEYYKTQNN